jgi:exosortase family protein XrtM
LSVLNGCEGTETLFLLVAAVVAFAASWRHKLWGILLGGLLVYGLNQIRIVALYFALRHDKELFSALHGYVGPTLIIILCSLFFLWWIGRIPRTPRDETDPA